MASEEGLSLRRLKTFQPLNRLADDQLVLLSGRAERRAFGPGQRVLERACNSPLYRGFSDVHNVRDSVIRLGMRTTRQLVTVFALREVAALCWVLADHVR